MTYKLVEAEDTKYAVSVVEQSGEGSLNFVCTELFRITADGTLIKGPAFTTIDDMSLKFWQAVEQASAMGRAPMPYEAGSNRTGRGDPPISVGRVPSPSNSDTSPMQEFKGIDAPSKVWAPGIDYSGPKFLCPMHGETEHVINSDIPGFEGHWCLKCAIANLERLRISKVEPIK
jgi:hypothetical protein